MESIMILTGKKKINVIATQSPNVLFMPPFIAYAWDTVDNHKFIQQQSTIFVNSVTKCLRHLG